MDARQFIEMQLSMTRIERSLLTLQRQLERLLCVLGDGQNPISKKLDEAIHRDAED